MYHLLLLLTAHFSLESVWSLCSVGISFQMGDTGLSEGLPLTSEWGRPARKHSWACQRQRLWRRAIWEERGEQWGRWWRRIWNICPGISGRMAARLMGVGATLAQCWVRLLPPWLSHTLWLCVLPYNPNSVLPGFPCSSGCLFLRHNRMQMVASWRSDGGGGIQSPLDSLTCNYVQPCPLGPAGTPGKTVVSDNAFLLSFISHLSYLIKSAICYINCMGWIYWL